MINEFSHDLKSPLAKIKAIVVIIKTSSDPKARGEGLTRIELAADVLNNNLENLFSLINIREGNIRLNYQFFDLNGLMSDLSKRYNFEYKAAGKIEFLADLILLKRALRILIENILSKNPTLVVGLRKHGEKNTIIMQFNEPVVTKTRKSLPWILAREIIKVHKGKLIEKKHGKETELKITL